MANNDYICMYREFFEEFAKTCKIQDYRPTRVNVYNLTIDELVGEVMQSCVNYLVERKCPRSLVVPLTKIVVEEFINEAKKQPEEVYTPLKLNKETHYKISEVCLRYTDNEKLSNLPGPVQETYYSTHSTKHKRRQMEDRLICLPRFNTLHGIQSNSEAGYYGIFDGHSGVTAASYAVSHLHQFLAESEYYPDDPVQAFRQAFQKTEMKYNAKDENSGTTVLAILHQPTEKKLTVAWVGDSQGMLVDQDSYVMLIDPHKPERTDERRRVEALGGIVINVQSVHRVNGGLAISRAIGDKKLKPYVSAEPEIRVLDLTGSEHFVVMGCDGLWDVVEPHEVIETVYVEVIKHQGQVDTVGRRLVDLAKENNSTDNISVIVIFLTDPAEISNHSVDVTGHRPKILHQDGVIMEANFQTNDKSPFNDPGMNGIYETNGNHFNAQNESDEDFGPETDVDAVDDVLTSPKNLNPFAKDCWQKTADENAEKLIEFTRQEPKNIEDEIMKFAEEFEEPAKPADEINSSQEISNDMKPDNFPVDNSNPFGAPVMNNIPVPSNVFDDFSDDNNKYVEEIKSTKEEADDMVASNVADQSFDQNFSEKPRDRSSDHDLFGFDSNGFTDSKQIASFKSPQDPNLFINEETDSKVEEVVEKQTLESPVQKESVPAFNSEFQVVEASLDENIDSHSNEINSTSNKMDEFKDVTFETNEEAVNLISEGLALETTGNLPEPCSVIDTVEAEKRSDFFTLEKSVASKEGQEPNSELHSPSAPALDGELKDETVAESGGEIEDSEDDEWNYIKLGSGVHHTVPVDSNTSDLVPSSNELSEIEKPTMNSPLNPEADEFIPVSAMTGSTEYDLNMTPKKAIPQELTDIIASSPNWNNMNNISLPEESTFLSEIKSRPSNIYENMGSPQQEDFGERNNGLNTSLNFLPSGDTNKENEMVVVSEVPHGIDLASDMTSSFIDPRTMGSEFDTSKENPDLMNSQLEHSFIEKQEFYVNESTPEGSELNNVEVPAKLPDLLSPVPLQEDISPVTPVLDTVKPGAVEVQTALCETGVSEISQPPVSEVLASDISQASVSEVLASDISQPPVSDVLVSDISKPPVSDVLVSDISKPPVSDVLVSDISKPPVSEVLASDISKPVSEVVGPIASGSPVSEVVMSDISQSPVAEAVVSEISQPPIDEPIAFEISEPYVSEQMVSDISQSPLSKPVVADISQSPVPKSVADISQSSVPDPVVCDISQSPTSEIQHSESVNTNQVTTPLENEKLSKEPRELLEAKESVTPLSAESVVGSAAAVAVAGVGVAAAKKDAKKSTTNKSTPGATKTTTKPLLNGVKTSATTKKPTPATQMPKAPTPGKTAGTTAGPVSKTPVSKTSTITKTQQKSTYVSSTFNKVPARPRPTSAMPAVSKAPPAAKSTVTTSPTKTTAPAAAITTTLKSVAKAPAPGAASTLKAKARVSSTTAEKKPTSTMNGDAKTAPKRTEVITKKTGGTTTTTTSTTTTRVSLSGRPATAPAKPATTVKTTVTTTRTVTAKPRTTVSSTTTSSTLSTASKTIPPARKSVPIGSDKQAKEAANRLTSKTAATPKTNGVVQKSTTTTVTKTRKTLTSTTPSKTKNNDKTESKAEMILEEKVEIIQSENGAPLIENNTDINLINSIASE